MEYKVVLGDSSGDGHNLTKEFVVHIPDEFSDRQMLFENYKKNRETAGVGYENIAVEDEDYTVDNQLGRLTRIGLRFVHFKYGMAKEALPFDVVPVDAGEGFADGEELFADSDFGTVKLGDESYKRNHVYSYLKIVMYMIGHGLPGWEWRIIEDDMPKLFSGWDGQASLPHGGYGLMMG